MENLLLYGFGNMMFSLVIKKQYWYSEYFSKTSINSVLEVYWTSL